jgi:L-ascorbate metabolism protein UlaG (beta-lactamase superfamily)
MQRLRRALLASALGLLGIRASAAVAAEPQLRWLGHSAFELRTRLGKILLIDPWITNPKAPKDITFPRVDGILLTHAHFDHVGEAFELAKKFNAPLIASFELTEIAKKHGVTNVLPINASGSQHLGEVTVTAVPAVHSSGYKEGDNILYGGAALGFIIEEAGSNTIYHAGDTGVFQDMAQIAQLYHPQVVLLPIGGVFTMKPAEAAWAARYLQAQVIVPMHYGTFPALTGTPEQLTTELQRLALTTRVAVMTPGRPTTINELLGKK